MTAIVIVDASLHTSTVPSTYVAPGILQFMGVSATQGSTTGTLPASPLSGLYGGDTYTIVSGNIVPLPVGGIAGNYTSTGVAAVIPVGFAPTYVMAYDETAGVKYEWHQGMSAGYAIVTTLGAAGAASVVHTGSLFTITADPAGGSGDVNIVTLSATVNGAAAGNIVFRVTP